MINGDYEDDENINYYSVGTKKSANPNETQKSSIKTPDQSDNIIDPFIHKSREEDSKYDKDEFETARLHGEQETEKEPELINVRDDAASQEASMEIKNSVDYFDDSFQMQDFLHTIKKGFGKLKQKQSEDIKEQQVTPEATQPQSEDKEENKIDEEQTSEKVTFDQDQIDEETLEMIQEETAEHDTTKQKESVILTPDKPKSPSEPLFIPKTLVEEKQLQSPKQKEIEKLEEDIQELDAQTEKRKEELIGRVVRSAYSTMSDFKSTLVDNLDLNKSK